MQNRVDIIMDLIKQIQSNIKELESTNVDHKIQLIELAKLKEESKKVEEKVTKLDEQVEKLEEPSKVFKKLGEWGMKLAAAAGVFFTVLQLWEWLRKFKG